MYAFTVISASVCVLAEYVVCLWLSVTLLWPVRGWGCYIQGQRVE
jgi:hypothetical protein